MTVSVSSEEGTIRIAKNMSACWSRLCISLALLLSVCSGAFAQEAKNFSHPAGVSFTIPASWKPISFDQGLKLAEAQADISPKLNSLEKEILEKAKRIFFVTKSAEGGGITLSMSIDPLPPSDRLSVEEARSMKSLLAEMIHASGPAAAQRLQDVGEFETVSYQGTDTLDTDHLVCFVSNFSTTTPDGLDPNQAQYNCPAGDISVRFVATYNPDRSAEFSSELDEIIRSVRTN